ncbi:extracellular solute-binding protein [Pacificibacter marinus]|uniref:Bacterial extracellular solute-binding protein n=1 Tax=Pacificibacter marinus TaxID=658057 RepID=A0A1Y5SWL4_9RHOB|nr:extracellular solute-binding protein [Pacificibacter marinus]SEK66696.1 putative spermidine/putrescine transport system substrate-binding protein [Pacificibacter marinus]SLN46750.1 hypothetical protein PAM7971_02283 [Pacificibacter marinus]
MKTLLTSVTAFALSAGIAWADSPATDMSNMSWDDIVAQAQDEGQVTWYVWYFQDRFRPVVEAFEAEYGIDVIIPEGTGQGNSDKMLAEKGRETGDIDVLAWGLNDFDTIDVTALFQPLNMLPEDDGRVGELLGVDGKGHVLAYWGNQTGIAYDPAHVAQVDLPQTVEDIAAFWGEHPGKFGFNYEKGGSGPSFFQNIIRASTGIDLMDGEVSDERLAVAEAGFDVFTAQADDYVVTASNVDSITRLSDGELWMVPAWEDHLAGLQNSGEVRADIKFYIPEFGMYGGANGVAVPMNAPHPAAAAVFINWLTSADTQTLFNQTFGTAPMHAKADDSAALVSNAQRANQTPWGNQPFRGALEKAFIEQVILER